jgi:hypothetical protein
MEKAASAELSAVPVASTPQPVASQPSSAPIQFSQSQLQALAYAAQLKKVQNGASWFFWIAGLSVVNSILEIAGGGWYFLLGLGFTQLVGALATAFAKEAPELQTPVFGVALCLDVVVVGLFVLFGILARKGHRWIFVIGMIVYVVDGIIFLLGPDWLSIGFHVYALFWLFRGLQACWKLHELQQANADAAGGVPVLP